jgi:GT2 family glycosyltransferase
MPDSVTHQSTPARVGIIVPAYNYGRYLDECLASIVAQTYTDFTVLVIDNASTDNTEAVARAWVARDSRIRYVRNATNLGLGPSATKAYTLLDNPLMLLLSADDYLAPGFLEATASALARHPECVLAYSRWEAVLDRPGRPDHGQRVAHYIPEHPSGVVDETPVLLTQNWITNSICLWRREVCDVVGGMVNGELPHVGDWYLHLRLLSEGPAYFVNEPLGFYRVHGNAESDRLRSNGRSAPDHVRIYDLIATSERWPLAVRCLAKVHQIRWLTGAPLMTIARELGGPKAHSIIREMMSTVRHDVLVGAAQAVLEFVPAPNTLDSAQAALTALDEVLAEAPDHPMALALKARHAPAGSGAPAARSAPRGLAGPARRRIDADLARQPARARISVIVDARAGGPIRRTLRSLKHQCLSAAHIILLGASEALAERNCIHLAPDALPQWLAAHAASPQDWVLGLVAGDVLAPETLFLCARAADEHPAALIVYTDHDEIGADDRYANPHHKPDANIELLHSMPYIGRALLVRADQLGPAPSDFDLVASHGRALAALEAGGASALAHVPALLMHLDVRCAPARPSGAEQLAALSALVHARAERARPGTTVIDGPGQGQFAWLPPLENPPLVSIIVPTKDQLALLQRCLDSLLGTTRYPAFEVIVVDNDSQTDAAQAYLATLAAGADARVRVLRHPGAFNFSAMNNRAADIANGAYLVLLNNDTEVVDPYWLTTLMRHGVCSDVGVVGPLLVFPDGRIQHAGVVLGLLGPAEHPFTGADPDAPGYLGRAQAQQDYSAVTGACLLTRTALYRQLGGLDETRFAVSYNDIDYCLRARAAGYRTVWTPLTRLIHVSSASQLTEVEQSANADKFARFAGERMAFYQKWADLIAHDPAYNPNLSRREKAFTIETDPLLRFDPLARLAPRRALALLGAPALDCLGRLLEPLAALEAAGYLAAGVSRGPRQAHEVLANGADTVIIQLPERIAQLEALQFVLALPGITTLFDGDDLLRPQPHVDASAPDFLERLPETIAGLIRGCDALIVSNPRLAQALSGLHPAVRVVPPTLHPVLWRDAPSPTAPSANARPRIAWWHDADTDTELIAGLIEALGHRVEFLCLGPCPAPLAGRVRTLTPPASGLPAWLAKLNWDLAIAPRVPGRVAELGSDADLLRLGWCGRPVLCSAVAAHEGELPVTRLPGALEAWVDALSQRIDAPDQCAAEGSALQRAVIARQGRIDDYLARWQHAWYPSERAPAVPDHLSSEDWQAVFDARVGPLREAATPVAPPEAAIPTRAATAEKHARDSAGDEGDERQRMRAEERARATLSATPDAASRPLDPSYATFLKHREPKPEDLQFLEAAVSQWPQTPAIHVLVEARDSEFELLSNTLDSLGAQPYPMWSLSIVATSACPDPAIDELPNIDWLHRADAAVTPKQLFDDIVARRAADIVVYLPPGTEFDPLCLWRVAHEFVTRPDWMALYTDDDVIRMDGKRVEPRFKPDFNLDLLRSCDYVGPLWVRGGTWHRAGGMAGTAGARFYDLSLRVIEAAGTCAIGHVADPLLCLPVSPTLLINDRDAMAALGAHLDRQGICHAIKPGALHATWTVDYRHDTHPRVDIVLAYQNWLEFIEPCVDSLFRLTEWPDFRLILVDVASDDADCEQWAQSLFERHGERVIRSRLPGPWNRAAAFNHGAGLSDAPYLVFLHHDTQVLDSTWLERLMAHAQRGDVAAVAPRQIRPGENTVDMAGTIFGMSPGIGSPECDDTPIDYPGYLGRLGCVQDFNLLDSACLLVARRHFDAVGRFDPDFGLRDSTTELSARLAGHGRLVWTPRVTIAHYGTELPPIDLDAERECVDAAAMERARLARERIDLVERYLPVLARDGAWNVNLRLTPEEVRPESGFVVPWHAIPARVPRLVADVVHGAGEFRAIAPLRAARRAGKALGAIIEPISTTARRLPNVIDLARLEGLDSYLVHNPAMVEQVPLLRQVRTHMPSLHVVGLLDDLTTAVPHTSDVFENWSRETRTHMRRCLAQCDRLVVSTEPLAEFARHMIDDIRIVPNRVEWARWEGIASRRRVGRKPRVGWAGAFQHAGDLALIEEAVRQTCDEVDWVFFGMCPPALAPYIRESHGWVDFDHYPAKLASLNLDLAVAPLVENAFNEAKSNLRLLDYGVLGWPVVCSDVAPYRGAPVMRVTNTTEAWVSAIRDHVNDLDAAEQAGDTLRSWVMADYILEDHVDEWLRHHLP